MRSLLARLLVLGAIGALLPSAAAHASGSVTLAGTQYTWTGTSGADVLYVTATQGGVIGGRVAAGPDDNVIFYSTTAISNSSGQTCTAGTPNIFNPFHSLSCPRIVAAGAITRINANGDADHDELTYGAPGRTPPLGTISLPVTFNGGAGPDTLSGSGVGDILFGSTEADTVHGGAGNDEIHGNDGNDVLLSGGVGDDTVRGETGNDVLRGDTGRDLLFGEEGDDSVTGGLEDDQAVSGGSNATAAGDEIRYDEADRAAGVVVDLTGSAGPDGTPGNETSESATGFERVVGTAFDDQLTGDSGGNVLVGGGGADRLNGGAGDDTVLGGAGADTLVADLGSDTMDGGADADTGDWTARTEALTISVGDATFNDGGAGDISSGVQDKVLAIERVLAGSGADALSSAEAGPIELHGNGGDDQLTGTAAADLLVGGAGADDMDGGAGADTVAYTDAGRAEGVVVTLSSGFEDDGSAFDANGQGQRDTLLRVENVTGSPFDDILGGDPSANQLDGGAGNDVLRGNTGTDVLRGGEGSDTVSYEERSEGVTVTLDGVANDGAAGENDDVGADIEDARGGLGPDSLTGNDGANVLTGNEGADTLTGGGAVDTFRAGAGDDTLRAHDGNAEPVDCGDGNDNAEVDAGDQLTGCETSAVAKPLVDADGDGFPEGQDCNDSNPAIRPGATEIPGNAVDEDCVGGPKAFEVITASLSVLYLHSRNRTRFTDVTVKSIPAGASVLLTCKRPKGRRFRRACPFTRVSRTFATATPSLKLLSRFKKRRLVPGVVVELRVTHPLAIGKVRRVTTRPRKAPRQQSLCLVPGATTPLKCP